MSIRSVLSAGVLVTTGVIIGRVMGLMREMLLAAQFGTGSTADMAIALLIIPDFVAAVFIGYAVSAVLIPAFAKSSEEKIFAMLWQTLLVTLVVFSIIAAICTWIFAGNINSTALFIAFSSIPFSAATASFTAYLQYRDRFVVPAFANAIFNVVVLITLWFAPDNLVILSLGILSAAILRLAAHYFAFIRAGGKIRVSLFKKWELNRELLIAYLHTSGSGVCGVLPLYVPYAVVAVAASGVAAFNYAFKLLLFPAILGQTIVQLVLLPWFVKMRVKNPLSVSSIYSTSLQVSWAASLAIALSVSLAGWHIAAICFGYGKMTASDIENVGSLIAVGVWATPGLILTSVWQQMLYATEQTRQALIANIALAIAIAPFCWVGHIMFGQAGTLAAYAIAQLIPLYILARTGRNFVGLKMIPSARYISISAAVFIVFALLAVAFHQINPSPFAGVVLAIMIGMLSLAAGLWQCGGVKEIIKSGGV